MTGRLPSPSVPPSGSFAPSPARIVPPVTRRIRPEPCGSPPIFFKSSPSTIVINERACSRFALALFSVKVLASPEAPTVRPPVGTQLARMLELGMYSTSRRLGAPAWPKAWRSNPPPSSAAVAAPTPPNTDRRDTRMTTVLPFERQSWDCGRSPRSSRSGARRRLGLVPPRAAARSHRHCPARDRARR